MEVLQRAKQLNMAPTNYAIHKPELTQLTFLFKFSRDIESCKSHKINNLVLADGWGQQSFRFKLEIWRKMHFQKQNVYYFILWCECSVCITILQMPCYVESMF